MVKKIYITVEDTKKGKVIIPIRLKDANSWFDYMFFFDSERDLKILKMNRMEKEWARLNEISAKILDAWSDGKCYEMPKDGDLKKFPISKQKMWLSGKPARWRKE